MTMPFERSYAVVRARQFLLDLASRKTKRIPTEVREEARRILRHFPSEFDLNQVEGSVFGRVDIQEEND